MVVVPRLGPLASVVPSDELYGRQRFAAPWAWAPSCPAWSWQRLSPADTARQRYGSWTVEHVITAHTPIVEHSFENRKRPEDREDRIATEKRAGPLNSARYATAPSQSGAQPAWQ